MKKRVDVCKVVLVLAYSFGVLLVMAGLLALICIPEAEYILFNLGLGIGMIVSGVLICLSAEQIEKMKNPRQSCNSGEDW